MLVENVSQKATGVEGADSDDSGGDRKVYDRPHRPARGSDAALRGLPAGVPEGAQRASSCFRTISSGSFCFWISATMKRSRFLSMGVTKTLEPLGTTLLSSAGRGEKRVVRLVNRMNVSSRIVRVPREKVYHCPPNCACQKVLPVLRRGLLASRWCIVSDRSGLAQICSLMKVH